MPGYSTFQTLPMLIAEGIARYLFVVTDSHFPRYYHEYEIKKVNSFPALCEISQLWRNIALRHSCRLIRLNLSWEKVNGYYWEFLDRDKPVKLKEIHNLEYVESVWVKISSSCLRISGLGLQRLDEAWPNSYVFSSARKAKIEYYNDGRKYGAINVKRKNKVLSAIITRVFSCMPKLKEVHIDSSSYWLFDNSEESRSATACSMEKILAMALPKVKRLCVDGIALEARSPLCLRDNIRLTHLEWYGVHNTGICQCIIKLSALTLNTLSIACHPFYGVVQGLLFDGDKVVSYPRLEKLKLDYYQGFSGIPAQKVDETTVPFPALKQFCWKRYYPFADDTPFRGNSSTLECLSMDLSNEFLQIAQEYRIFYEGSHLKLQHIISEHFRGFVRGYARTDIADMELNPQLDLEFTVGLIPSTIQALRLDLAAETPIFLRIIPEYPHMRNIQALEFGPEDVKLSETINLLKLLPNLTLFRSIFGGLGTFIEEIDYNDLPEHLYSQYYPLSNHFICWHVYCRTKRAKKSLGLAAVFLAIICPRFTLIPLNDGSRDEYFRRIRGVLSTKPFSDYAERVQHLLKD